MTSLLCKSIALLKKNILLKTSIKNSLQVLLRFFIGIVNIKVVAFYIGPTGMALISQLQNFLQMGTIVSGLGFNNGIIKYGSELKPPSKQYDTILSTAFTSIIITSVLMGLISALSSETLSKYLFSTPKYAFIIQLSGIHFLSLSIINFFLAYLNGIQKLYRFIVINIILSLSGFAIGLIFILHYGLIGLMWAQISIALPTLTIIALGIKKIFSNNRYTFSLSALQKLSTFSLMAITSGILGHIAPFVIRKIIAQQVSWQIAGLWDGLNKISSNYIMLLTMSFSYYFLPTFAKLTHSSAIKKELLKSFKTVIPILFIGSLALYFSKDIIIKLLFTSEFNAISSLFIWQIIGDFFKVLSWIIAYLLIAKEQVKIFISTELISVILQIAFAYWFTKLQLPINIYYCVENIIYFIILISCLYIFFTPSPLHRQSCNTNVR